MGTEDLGYVRDSLNYLSEAEENDLHKQIEELQKHVKHLKGVIEQGARTVKAADEVLYNQVRMVVAWNKRLDELQAENKRLSELSLQCTCHNDP